MRPNVVTVPMSLQVHLDTVLDALQAAQRSEAAAPAQMGFFSSLFSSAPSALEEAESATLVLATGYASLHAPPRLLLPRAGVNVHSMHCRNDVVVACNVTSASCCHAQTRSSSRR